MVASGDRTDKLLLVISYLLASCLLNNQ